MDDLIGEFITETSESLSTLDLELVKLEQNPDNSEILGNIFRLVHTIKGTCGFLGLPRLESVAHAGENVLGKVRDKQIVVNPKTISLVLEALDCIKDIMSALSETGSEPEGDDSDLKRRLNRYADTCGADDGSGGAIEIVALVEEEEDPLEKAFREAVVLDDPSQAFASSWGDAAPAEEKSADEKIVEKVEAPEKVEAQVITPAAKVEAPAAAKPKEAAPSGGGDGGGVNQSIRVSIDVLENLMQMVGELVLTRNQLAQVVRTKDDNDFKNPLQRLSYITSELQEGVMKTRMQPIGNAWAKFPRLVRDLSLELNKKIELRMIGAETELDRQLLEMIKDPLTHMVRNSCDHGLETTEERRKTTKPESGTVTLSAFHEGGHIIVQISDDGRGINVERVKEKAVSSGLATADELEMMTDHQIAQFIFKAGFSTAEKVTSVSGRGVGMDVVRNNIEKIGGTVELESTPGKGSLFHIKIPLTLAIVSVLIVRAGGEKFAIPQINVMELVRTGDDTEHKVELIKDAPVLRLRDKLLPLISLARLLQLDDNTLTADSLKGSYVVVCSVGTNEFGLIVDVVYDTEEIVVKPVSRCLQHIPVYSGNTVLGDGRVIMILDPNGIAKSTGSDLDSGGKDENAGKNNLSSRLSSFLLFVSGDATPKAVPLELVSRLEELDVSQIEYSNHRPVVQYRGDLMRLTSVDGQTIPETGKCEVIVFTYDGKTVGLVVKEILDIVSAEPIVKLTSDDKTYLGSIVMSEKSTDVVDVGQLLSRVLEIDMNLRELTDGEAVDASMLFVEDSMFFRNLTIPFLSAVGYRVTSAVDGLDGLHQMQNNNFAVIVTDIEMPNMDGFEFAKSVRSNHAYSDLPIIAFTSTVNEAVLQKAQESGINFCVLKTDREKLVRTISESLNKNYNSSQNRELA